MKNIGLLAFLLWVGAGVSYAQLPPPKENTGAFPKDSVKNKKTFFGIASYYADKFDGRRTANGSIYRMTGMTAACNVLPLNKWIRVTNLKNKKSIILKITDRMHPKSSRLVDLSKAAAQKLHFISEGLVRVKVEVLNGYKP